MLPWLTPPSHCALQPHPLPHAAAEAGYHTVLYNNHSFLLTKLVQMVVSSSVSDPAPVFGKDRRWEAFEPGYILKQLCWPQLISPGVDSRTVDRTTGLELLQVHSVPHKCTRVQGHTANRGGAGLHTVSLGHLSQRCKTHIGLCFQPTHHVYFLCLVPSSTKMRNLGSP